MVYTKAILLLLFIAAIEFNLQWNGFENQPNWVKVYDENKQEVAIKSEIKSKLLESGFNKYEWEIYDEIGGNLITFLHFWTY